MPVAKYLSPILFLSLFSTSAFALAAGEPQVHLDSQQAKSFRSWLVTIVEDQVSRGANPRWHHRDCAGLVRFAVHEALLRHDDNWRKANGFIGRPLPAEIDLGSLERESLKQWKDDEKKSAHFVQALTLVQQNAQFIGKTMERVEPGDLLFFDQGDDQHLMIWTGSRIVYHNGQHENRKKHTSDQGLRALSLEQLMNFPDSRWQPRVDNPNFIGFYRFSFLTNRFSFSSRTAKGTP